MPAVNAVLLGDAGQVLDAGNHAGAALVVLTWGAVPAVEALLHGGACQVRDAGAGLAPPWPRLMHWPVLAGACIQSLCKL